MNNDQFLVAAAADQTLSVWKLIDRNEEDENDIKKYNIEISEDDDEKVNTTTDTYVLIILKSNI